MRVEIKWEPASEQYRVSRVEDDGTEKMFAFFCSFADALDKALYFQSFGDVR